MTAIIIAILAGAFIFAGMLIAFGTKQPPGPNPKPQGPRHEAFHRTVLDEIPAE